MNRTVITREREAAAIAASALAHPATAAILREAKILTDFWAEESADPFADLLASDGELREPVGIPVNRPRIDPLAPHGMGDHPRYRSSPGRSVHRMWQGRGKVERDNGGT